MIASVMLEKSSKYEVLDIGSKPAKNSLLILHKESETGSPFLVVAGYFLNEVGKFEQSVLAEIETVPESDYAKVKDAIREKTGNSKKIPITFW
jgi:hypothetical protein